MLRMYKKRVNKANNKKTRLPKRKTIRVLFKERQNRM
jgi:hypothetical protein